MTVTDEQSKERLVALVDLIGRTGAQGFQLRYSDDEAPVVWIAVAGYKRGLGNMVYEVGASCSPDRAAFRLAPELKTFRRGCEGGTS